MIKLVERCQKICMTYPKSTSVSEIEKKCASNCIKKYDVAYKFYEKAEDKIFIEYMEKTDVDPQQFFATINELSPEEYNRIEKQMQGNSMDEAKQQYSGYGKTQHEKYFNHDPDEKLKAQPF